MPRATQPITADEFVERIPDGQKADLLDGVIYMASPDSPEAADVNGFISFLLRGFTRRRRLGKVYGPRSGFRLTDTYVPEPDVAFVSRDRLHLWQGAIFHGAPDLAVEVVTPDSRDRDPGIKRKAYERAEVREYWMVHLFGASWEFLRLDGKTYRDVTPKAGAIFRSEVVPGFWIDPAWVFADELPDDFECLSRILGV